MIQIRDSVRVPGSVKATYWLLGLNLLSFFAANSLMAKGQYVFLAGGVIPADFTHPELLNGFLIQRLGMGEEEAGLWLAQNRIPALLTLFWAMFLHDGWFHLLSNGIALLIFGPNIEAYMGRIRFLLFYFGCGTFGFFCQVLFNLNSVIPVIGASGAISGLFGAYFVLFSDHYIRITLGDMRRSYRDIALPVKALLIIWLASQIFHGIIISLIDGQNSQVAYLTHIGGFICGFLIANGRGGGSRRQFKVFTGGRARGDFR